MAFTLTVPAEGSGFSNYQNNGAMLESDQNENTISVSSDELEHCLTETGRQQDT